MPVIAVINRKGGSGKSTLAAHLAAYCATTGKRVMLGDVDRQQSAQTWLKLRGTHNLPDSAAIQGWAIDPKNVLRVPAGVTHVILDTPGGMRGFELARIVMNADVILMPVCNSLFDRDSAAECFAELKSLPRVASGRCKIAAIGMRVDARTKAAEVLAAWSKKIELPFVGVLRETQVYVRSIEAGLTLFDMQAAQVQGDLAQWQSILRWLDPVLNPKPAATTAPKPEFSASPEVIEQLARAITQQPVAAVTRQPTPVVDQQPTRAITQQSPLPVIQRPTPAANEEPAPAKPLGVSRPIVPSVRQALRPVPGSVPARPATAPAPARASNASVPERTVTAPVTARPSTAQAPARPAPAAPARPRPAITRTEPARPGISTRIGQLLDTLPIPRFLQRNP
jgi:chromosome partitioning protein